MTSSEPDSRAIVAELELVAVASGFLTDTIAIHLPFEGVVAFKAALKRFFSHGPWTDDDAQSLSSLVAPHVQSGWWSHDLGHGLTMDHGVDSGRYTLQVTGGKPSGDGLFRRAFSGPVRPEQTPHPRKIKFPVGGHPAPGVWHRRGEDIDDERVLSLMEDEDISDVMVAGDFVTVGIRPSASWEDRLDDILSAVTDLFWIGTDSSAPLRTREQLLEEAGRAHTAPIRAEDLHLMDPDDSTHRATLVEALGSSDPRRRRAAVVTLALSSDAAVANAAIVTGYRDTARMVRRASIDAAADRDDEEYRPLFEAAVFDPDTWTRWRAVKAIAAIGIKTSEETMILAAVDEDFRVRFEAASALER